MQDLREGLEVKLLENQFCIVELDEVRFWTLAREWRDWYCITFPNSCLSPSGELESFQIGHFLFTRSELGLSF